MRTTVLLTCAVMLCAGTAFASHKAWLLKNGGGDCAFTGPMANEFNAGPLVNTFSSNRTAVCPVALSSRWGSNGSGNVQFPPPRWADALSAVVYYKKAEASSTISCFAALQTPNGSLWFSPTAVNNGGVGIQKVVLATQVNDQGTWGAGSSLENNENVVAKSLDFTCLIPAGGQTQLLGYRMKNCQNIPDCHNSGSGDGETDHGTSADGGENYVQTSGMECSSEGPAADVSSITGSLNGTGNIGSTARRVFCPIAPPADDSREHNRTVSFTKVHYKGGSTSSNCVSQGTCPNCVLKWWDRNGTAAVSVSFAVNSARYVQQSGSPNQLPIGKELQVGVSCSVPGFVTINGITSIMSVTDVSGGT